MDDVQREPWDMKDGRMSCVLKTLDYVPELAKLSGHSEEYLTARFHSAQAVGRRIYASITWPKRD